MSMSIDRRIGKRLFSPTCLVAVLVASLALAACRNDLGPTAPKADTRLSVVVSRLSPLFAEAFASAGQGKELSPSRAVIGATRVDFVLRKTGETSPLLEWSLKTSNTFSQGDANLASTVVVPDDAEFCVLEARVFNSAVSDTEPVVSGRVDVPILPLSSNNVTVTCVPASPVLAGSLPYTGSASPKPFVLQSSTVTSMGQESWYKIVPTTSSISLAVSAASGNGNTIACGLYNGSGRTYFDGYSHMMSATAASPVDKWVKVTAGATYYLGIAQKAGTGGTSDDIRVEIAEGPGAPAAPTLSAPEDKPGQIDVSWTPDPRMSGYDIYYKASYYDSPVLVNSSPLANTVTSHSIVGLKPGHPYSIYLVSRRADSYAWLSDAGAAASATPVHSRQTVDDGTRTWMSETIGDTAEGSATWNPTGPVYGLRGGGWFGGLMNGESWFHFLHVPQSGDFTLVARIASATAGGVNETGIAGIAVFDGASPSASRIALGVQFKDAGDGAGTKILASMELLRGGGSGISFGLASVHSWVKAQRTGNTLQFWSSEDGVTWTARKLYDRTTSGYYDPTWTTTTPEIGLFVAAGSFNNLANVTFDNVSLIVP